MWSKRNAFTFGLNFILCRFLKKSDFLRKAALTQRTTLYRQCVHFPVPCLVANVHAQHMQAGPMTRQGAGGLAEYR